MRATLNIPDELISEVQKLSGEKSKTKAIITAMEEFIRQKKIKELIALQWCQSASVRYFHCLHCP